MKFLHLPFISRIQCLKEFQNTKCLPVFILNIKKPPTQFLLAATLKTVLFSFLFFPLRVLDKNPSDEGAPTAVRMQQKRNIQIIEWEDLDKKKFYSFGLFMTMTIRATVYPATLIRTRLQVQKGKSLYGGTFDAFFKILRVEGVRGLYRGFMVNTFTLISGQAYITTYELVRKYVSQYSEDNTVKSLVAGGSASLVAQSITVPIDVISQQLMMQGQGQHLTRFRLDSNTETGKPKKVFGQTRNIIAQIFAADGFRGFYRGYVASLLTYIPNSAVWWPFYHFYAGKWKL